jgi:hypothetical protein
MRALLNIVARCPVHTSEEQLEGKETTSSGGEWLLAWVPRNGDRAGVSICPEGDHAGRACEVPQEDQSPSMYNDQYMCVLVKRY